MPPFLATCPEIEDRDEVLAENSVLITFNYQFQEGTNGKPTEEEIVQLMCQTDAYVQQQIRRALGGSMFTYYGSLTTWDYNENATFPVSIRFLANATDLLTGDSIDRQIIYDAMDLGDRDYRFYVSNYLLETSAETVFQNVTAVNSTREFTDGSSTSRWPNTCLEGIQELDNGGSVIDVDIGESKT